MDENDEQLNQLVPVEVNANPGVAGAADEEAENQSTSEDEDDEAKRRRMGAKESRNNSQNADDGGATVDPSGNNQESEKPQPKVTFNRSLPASHVYLGRDLEEVGVGGQGVFEDNTIMEGVPLFPVPNLILMPGQTLPLQSLHPRAISMFRAIIARSQMFGVVNVNIRGVVPVEGLSNLGTLTQVLAFKEATEHEVTSLKLRAVGRERFEILETQRQIDGSLVAKIKILPEIGLGSPLENAELPCMQRFKASERLASFKPRRQRNKYFSSAFTHWPSFVYKQYDLVQIVNQLTEELRDWYDTHRVEQLSKLPVEFSYWVAANLPLDNDAKVQLLSINCVLQRLRCELSLVKRFTILVCRGCSTKIGEKANLFSMSLDGVIGAFVNPHGFVHETITLTEAVSVAESGFATTENSWFPGYAWTIVNCGHCGDHLGWKFEARRRNLKPKVFYGISRGNILPSRDHSAPLEPDDEENLPFM